MWNPQCVNVLDITDFFSRSAIMNSLSMKKNNVSRGFVSFLSFIFIASILTQVLAAKERDYGDSRVIAEIPSEPYPGSLGFPESVVINGNRAYVSTPATFGTAGTPPAKIYAFDVRYGTLEETYEIQGQDINYEHPISGLTFDGDDRLYVLDLQQGVVRLTLDGQSQESYTPPFPDLPPTSFGDEPPLPNEMTFDHDGNLYVSDTLQGVIYRIPPGGGSIEVWLQHPCLDSPFGANAVRVSPDGNTLFFGVTITSLGQSLVCTIPITSIADPDDVEVFHLYEYGEGPDGFTFGDSGRLYVPLAYSHEISVLDTDGEELCRFTGPAASDPDPVPYDNPAVAAFNNRDKTLFVTNHALFSQNPDHFVLFDVYVGEPGHPDPRPMVP
jgi:sugar lactone lactonase YvrE